MIIKMPNIPKEELLNKMIKIIKEQEININKANKIDKKHYKMKVHVNKLLQLTESLKEKDIGEFAYKNVVIVHNGNPYMTYILAIKAICSNTNIDICVSETMLATNLIIVQLLNEILKEMKIQINIEVIRILDTKTLEKEKDKKIIVLQDKAEYSRLLKQNIPDVYYKPIYNVALYIDNEEFEEIKQDIIKYCDENFIEIEIYEADNVEDAILQMEADNEGEYALILTKEKVDLNKIQEIKEKENIEIYINKNVISKLEERIIRAKIG